MSYTQEDEAHIERILNTKNFYEILQVPNNASEDQIKSAHKKLALLVHPDKNNAPAAKDAFVAVRKATACLLDKGMRRDYDEYLRSPRGFCEDKFDLSEEAADAILIAAGIGAVVGIVTGLLALYKYFTAPKREEQEPKYS
ncbi:hypothetical protein QAD02_011138 [Eretmocerus hayati]|uniref:Uncharacterized protein n=1 Tax=Eretmocerus hayati TaxID=131215 RepID=A0ACC2NW70_9HYME|nr:hypothetical protein QAD02_011138 [Eretmocerus hayati]